MRIPVVLCAAAFLVGSALARLAEAGATCELEIRLKAGADAPDLPFEPIGKLAVLIPKRLPSPRTPETATARTRPSTAIRGSAPPSRWPDYAKIRKTSTQGWRVEHASGPSEWIYIEQYSRRHAVSLAGPVVLGGLRPATYRIDYLPRTKRRGDRAWVLPKPVEVELKGKAEVVLELQLLEPFSARGRIRLPEGTLRPLEKRHMFLQDVTAGHRHRLRDTRTDADGHFAFVVYPKRRYRFRTVLGTGGGLDVQSEVFAAEDYRDKVFEWLLAKASLATWRIELLVEQDGQRVPYREKAYLSLDGERTGAGGTIRDGVRRISVFRGIEEHFGYLVEGHRYRIQLSSSTAQRFYSKGPGSFTVPKGLTGERAFQLVLAPKPELKLRCIDQATGEPMEKYRLFLRPAQGEGSSLGVCQPPPPHAPPTRLAPGKYTLRGEAKGYKRLERAVAIAPKPLEQTVDIAFSPLSPIRVRVARPAGHAGACQVRLFYTDGFEPRPESRARLGGDDTVSIPCDDDRPRALHVMAQGLAPFLVPVEKQDTDITVHMTPGVQLALEVRVNGEQFGRDNPAMVFLTVPRIHRMALYQRAMLSEDGKATLRVLPGEYALYFAVPKAWKWGYHLGAIEVEGDLVKTYEFASFDELEPNRVTDDLVPARKR